MDTDKSIIEFFVDSKPVGKARARVVNGHAYTPKKTVAFENFVRAMALKAYGKTEPYEGDVGVTIKEYYEIPKSWTKKKKLLAQNNDIRPSVKPDIDNVVKSVLDGMNTTKSKLGIYRDDKQVVSLTVDKWYSDKPGVYVWVEFLN